MKGGNGDVYNSPLAWLPPRGSNVDLSGERHSNDVRRLLVVERRDESHAAAQNQVQANRSICQIYVFPGGACELRLSRPNDPNNDNISRQSIAIRRVHSGDVSVPANDVADAMELAPEQQVARVSVNSEIEATATFVFM